LGEARVPLDAVRSSSYAQHILSAEEIGMAMRIFTYDALPGTAPDGKKMDVPFYTMSYDFILAPAEEKNG
jgi:hypothetical protein